MLIGRERSTVYCYGMDDVIYSYYMYYYIQVDYSE